MNQEYKLTLKKIFGHLRVVNKHRFKVFSLCCKARIPIRGILHDLSKYSPEEFIESARYFGEGKFSPIRTCKQTKGYSNAWIHHKNHNKHHYEYWYDYAAPTQSPIMPLKYYKEMVCDSLAAGMTYQGKNWTKEYQLSYWNKAATKDKIHPSMVKLLDRVYTDVSKDGLDKVIKGKNLDKLYEKYTKEDK